MTPLKKTYPLGSNIAYVLRGIRQFDPAMIPLMALSALLTALAQFLPVIAPKFVLDELIGPARAAVAAGNWPGTATFFGLTLGFGLSVLVSNVIDTIIDIHTGNRMITVRHHFMLRMGGKFTSTSYQNLERPEVLDLAEKASKATESNWQGVEGILRCSQDLVRYLIALGLTAWIITLLQPLLLIIFLAIVLFNSWLQDRTRTREKALNDALAPVWRRLWNLNWLLKDFQFAKDLRLFGLAPMLLGKLRKEQNRRLESQTKGWAGWLVTFNVMHILLFVQEGLMYAYLLWQILLGQVGVGDLVMYTAAIRVFNGNLFQVMDSLSHIRFQGDFISDYRSFMDLEDEHPSGRLPVSTRAVPRFEFRNVSFRYSGQERDTLAGLDLTIAPGERLAVVGLNGAGKTTFVKLLTRLYEPAGGQLLMDGRPARDYDRDQYYRLFAPVFQEMDIYAMSFQENVAMDRRDSLDGARVRTALETAGLGDKLAGFARGLDQPLGKDLEDDGVELSGGELQKLALARALYKDAPVLVLDEPTSALDALAEERLYQEFDRLSQGKTAIYISHRLASTRFCDRIAVFEDGRVVETGTHQELLDRGGSYARLYEVQARNYRMEGDQA